MFRLNAALHPERFQHIIVYPLYKINGVTDEINSHDNMELLKIDKDFGDQLKYLNEKDSILLNSFFWGENGENFKIPIPYSRKGLEKHRYFVKDSIFSKEEPKFSINIKDIAILIYEYLNVCREKSYLQGYSEKMQKKTFLLSKDELTENLYRDFKKFETLYVNPTHYWNLDIKKRKEWDYTYEKTNQLFPSSLTKMRDCNHLRLSIEYGKIKCSNCLLLAHAEDLGELTLALEGDHSDVIGTIHELMSDKPSDNRIESLKWIVKNKGLFEKVCILMNEAKLMVSELRNLKVVSGDQFKKSSNNIFVKINKCMKTVTKSDSLYKSIPTETALFVLDAFEAHDDLVAFQTDPNHFLAKIIKQNEDLLKLKDEYWRTFKLSGKQQHFGGVELPFERTLEVMLFLESLDGKYGITTLADVLVGSKVQKMFDFNLYKHEYYGYLSDKTRQFALKTLHQLMDNDLVVKIGRDYPKLHLTELGKTIIDSTKTEVPVITIEEQKEMFLKKSYAEVFDEIGWVEKPLLDAYMKQYFSNTNSKQYRLLLEKLKNRNEDRVYEKFLPYLVKEYRDEYLPVLEFIIDSRRNSRYAIFIKDVCEIAKKGDVVSVS